MSEATSAVSTGTYAARCRAAVSFAATAIGADMGVPPTPSLLHHLSWHCGGIDPAHVLAILQTGLLSARDQGVPCQQHHEVAADPLDQALPLPHPLDFEWRYTPTTRRWLADRIAAEAGPTGSVALLGTPTLVPFLVGRVARLLVVDSNAAVVHRLSRNWPHAEYASEFVESAAAPGWANSADVVVCDPPWYPEAMRAFLGRAERLSRIGAMIYFSAPDELVRPTAAAELEDTQRYADQLGLELTDIERHALRYRTPFFEYRAWLAAGLVEPPLDWRVGTLWQLRRRLRGDRETVAPPAVVKVEEVAVRESRIRILDIPRDGPLLSSLIAGDVLPTVSARHYLRAQANVWTSGNSVLATGDPRRLAAALRRDRDAEPADVTSPEVRRIYAVVRAEQADLREYRRRTGYETRAAVTT